VLRLGYTVVDIGGNLVSFARMDDAPIMGIEGAQRKACSALLGVSTADFYDGVKGHEGTVHGLSHLPGSIMVPGGVPIVIAGEVVGGIGASGGLPEEDVACAEAGMAVLASDKSVD
jgi:uncharacterized protein GlcG (DUF336 family)